MNNAFPKKEHLFGVKPIDRLHTQGKAFIAYPLRVVYLMVDKEEEMLPIRVMVNVSKKKFKRAVKRNRLKRLMREAYRLNKNQLIPIVCEQNIRLHIAFQYIAKEEISFEEVNAKMCKALEKLVKLIAEDKNDIDESI